MALERVEVGVINNLDSRGKMLREGKFMCIMYGFLIERIRLLRDVVGSRLMEWVGNCWDIEKLFWKEDKACLRQRR